MIAENEESTRKPTRRHLTLVVMAFSVLVLCMATTALFGKKLIISFSMPSSQLRRSLSTENNSSSNVVVNRRDLAVGRYQQPPFNQTDLEGAISLFGCHYTRLFLFDGQEFAVYSIRDKRHQHNASKYCGRCHRIIPLLIHSIKTNFPERVSPGQPPFQFLMSDADSVQLDCTQHDCRTLPPILAFSSVPKDKEVVPSVQAFPTWFFVDCIYNWIFQKQKQQSFPFQQQTKECEWKELDDIPPHATMPWEALKPAIGWRGSDFNFCSLTPEYRKANLQRVRFPILKSIDDSTTRGDLLELILNKWDEFTPRWRAVIMSDLAQNSWLDAKFTDVVTLHQQRYHAIFASHGITVNSDPLTSRQLSQYRYHLDLGGGGCTTWRGTLTKLSMPGVLFHHETAMKDWFYDMMVPWVHYIPVRWDLSNLHEMYQWAEKHPERCQEISKAASALAEYILSPDYIKRVYNDLFRDYVGSVIESYRPSFVEEHPRFQSYEKQSHIIRMYNEHGYEMERVSICSSDSCYTYGTDEVMQKTPYIPNMPQH